MGVNQRKYFCRHLASWLYASEWHFTTLLAITIESVDRLPDDADQLVNDLLQTYPNRPSIENISNYLSINQRVINWFNYGNPKPGVKSICLERFVSTHEIDKNIPPLENSVDIAYWLGISLNQLSWLTDTWRRDSNALARFNHYHYSLVAKRHGGMRLIESPKRLLKQIQRQINLKILSHIPVHDAAHGFCQQRSCVTHARNHSGKKYLLLFDITHCFHSIHWLAVYRVFIKSGYSESVANTLACLCTHQFNSNKSILYKLDPGQCERIKTRHLPQGAPTSPALSNIILYQLDKRLSGLADSLQLKFSRYADDLAFSGNRHRDWLFLESLIASICMEEGFALNHRKTRILKSHQRQKLTGIVVNKTPNIDRRYYDKLKATLFNCLRFGMDSQNREQHDNFQAHLLGRINYVSALNHRKGEKLRSIFNQIITAKQD